ncbi:hypothetical protein JCM10212_005730 [Sporobolomyces blumeae]
MSGCTGCWCTRRSSTEIHERAPYSQLAMSPPRPPPRGSELVVLSTKDNAPVHLSLTDDGLAVVKRKPGSLHSLKLANPSSSTSTRLIPYLSLLSASCSLSPTSANSITLTLSALVPSTRSDPASKSKLWTLAGTVVRGGHESESDATVEEWCKTAEERAYAGVPRARRFHVILNPIGGKGFAKKVWETSVRPVLDASRRATYDVSHTGPPGSPSHAFELGRKHDPREYDALVSLSGDGIVHELMNGLAHQEQAQAATSSSSSTGPTELKNVGKRALRETPIVHVPCGSGNALATSIVGPEKVGDHLWCVLVGLKGNPAPIDICSVTQEGGKRLFSFLTQAFGLMADLDLGTEHLRFMGDFRFTWGYIQGAVSRRRYPLKLTVLVESSSKSDIANRHNRSLARTDELGVTSRALEEGHRRVGKANERDLEEADEDSIPPLVYGSPRSPLPPAAMTDLPHRRLTTLPKDGQLEAGKWWEIDLLGDSTEASTRGGNKSRDKGAFFVYGGKMPWVSKDVMLFPPADPTDGLVDLVVVAPMSPLEALTAMDGAESGKLFHHPSLLYLKTRAYRLTFPSSLESASAVSNGNAGANGGKGKRRERGGYVSIDGENLEHREFNVEVHGGLGRVMVLDGTFAGRRRIEGV